MWMFNPWILVFYPPLILIGITPFIDNALHIIIPLIILHALFLFLFDIHSIQKRRYRIYEAIKNHKRKELKKKLELEKKLIHLNKRSSFNEGKN